MKQKAWKSAPISPTCEVMMGREGDRIIFFIRPTDFAYPCQGSGWMALCSQHAEKHQPHVKTVEELVKDGEEWA